MSGDLASVPSPAPAGPGDAVTPQPDLVARSWGTGEHPPLRVPPPAPVDLDLAGEVNDRFILWLRRFGYTESELDRLHAADFGRHAVLTHPDVDDADRLLLAAQWFGAQFAGLEDRYTDGIDIDQARIGALMTLSQEAIDPAAIVHPHHRSSLDEHRRTAPALASVRAAYGALARVATPSQLARTSTDTVGFMLAACGEASWRLTGTSPPVWEYLVNRQRNSFLPFVSLIDLISGYELPANEFYSAPVRRVCLLAASVTTLANDLLSHGRDSYIPGDVDLILALARETGCGVAEATGAAVSLCNDYMLALDADIRGLLPTASAELARFLPQLRAFVAGNIEFQLTTSRYRRQEQ